MGTLLLLGLIFINTGISFWNAYAAGTVWNESRGWLKAVAVSALIMSVCGFISVLSIVLGFGAEAFGVITAKQFSVLNLLTYLFIIFPILGSGLAITIHSLVVAYKQRDFGSVATAGWNVFAMGVDTYQAADGGVSSAFKEVVDFFTDDDDTSWISIIFLISVVCAGGLTFYGFNLGKKNSISTQLA